MGNLMIRLAKNEGDWKKICNVRKKVFVEEQKISQELVFDDADKKAKQILAFYEDKVVGTMRILIEKN
jgi:predicted GNAT family N-acyltransferase